MKFSEIFSLLEAGKFIHRKCWPIIHYIKLVDGEIITEDNAMAYITNGDIFANDWEEFEYSEKIDVIRKMSRLKDLIASSIRFLDITDDNSEKSYVSSIKTYLIEASGLLNESQDNIQKMLIESE